MLSRQTFRRASSLRRTNIFSSSCSDQTLCLSTTTTRDKPHASSEDVAVFNLKRICLLRKITRYEFERYTHRHQTNNESELKKIVTDKGSDYQGLVDRHDEYHRRLETIHDDIVKRGLSVDVVKRPEYTLDRIEEADAIVSAGGDGTFLMAASKVKGHGKPVIGINTDIIRSEGKLCLPQEHSLNFGDSLDKLLNGKFKWRWRNRIRISMLGHKIDDMPVDIHDQELMYPEFRHWEHVRENEMHFGDGKEGINSPKTPPVILPIWALNEVFIGESLAARVSFYEVSVNGSPPLKQKSSGITVCTGTGSTSWFFNINHVPTCSVRQILEKARDHSSTPLNISDDLCEKVAAEFNNSLTFDPSDPKMAFVIRDPVPHGIFQVQRSRGFCKSMTIRSRMFDAWVAVDGGISFRFNDGAVAILEMFEEDALRCVTLD